MRTVPLLPIEGRHIFSGVGYQNGDACGAAEQCLSGFCVDGRCCNSSCGGGSTSVCISGICRSPGNVGDPCQVSAECQSGYCLDGYCCDGACSGQCEACDVEGKPGVCSPVSGAPRGQRTACASDGSVCGGVCDGTSREGCFYPGADVQCRPASCQDAVAVLPAGCQGNGSCPAEQTQDCAPTRAMGTSAAGVAARTATAPPANTARRESVWKSWPTGHPAPVPASVPADSASTASAVNRPARGRVRPVMSAVKKGFVNRSVKAPTAEGRGLRGAGSVRRQL